MELINIALTILVIFVVGVVVWLKQIQNYWTARNITTASKDLYFLQGKEQLTFKLRNLYQRYRDSSLPFVGLFIVLRPVALLLDLDLIKQILISEFESFPDRGFYHNVRDDPLSANLIRLNGEAWKRLRTKLTPTFSSGKMKFMFPTVVAVGQRLIDVIEEKQIEGSAELDIRDLTGRYSTDVIGTVAFGLECNSLRDRSAEFRLKGEQSIRSLNPFLEFISLNMQRLLQCLRVKAHSRELIDFYNRIVTESIVYREQNKVRRNDLLDILIEMKNSKTEADTALTLKEIIGQAFIFLVAGSDTSASAMAFCIYELSGNEELQEKTRKDVVETLAKHNDELTYECLKEMRYLEKVFQETLRKYPGGPTLRRVARKKFSVPNTEYVLESGVTTIIPVYSIHHDPAYYPDPETFDPERFSPEEIQKRHSMAYLPFGAGPRFCIAERFGRMQTLIGLAMVIKNFRFSRTERTQESLSFDARNTRIFSVQGGIQLMVEKI